MSDQIPTPEELRRMAERADDFKRQKAEVDGALGEVMKQLKREFGVASITQAEAALERMDRDAAKAARLARREDAKLTRFQDRVDRGRNPK
jgi:adenylyl- and sulfurtransferase ThiI